MTTTHFRNCNLCEAMCGIEIETENGVITTIIGDKKDTFSRGHICPKAVAMKDIYEDPNRLKKPVKRTPDGWKTISWEEAYSEVVSKLKDIQARYGNNAVGVYQGNPSIHNMGTTMNSPTFFRQLKTKNMFSATSTDQLPHHFAAWLMFGHPLLLPIPFAYRVLSLQISLQILSRSSTSAQAVLVLQFAADGKVSERMIPFVTAFVDGVDLTAKRITVDWQSDY